MALKKFLMIGVVAALLVACSDEPEWGFFVSLRGLRRFEQLEGKVVVE